MNEANSLLSGLRRRWQKLFSPPLAASDDASEAFEELVARYSEPQRHYHNLDHLQQVLAVIGSLSGLAVNLTAVELAAWFHDAIYDPRAADNEAQSAALAAATLPGLAVPPATIRQVEQLILATQSHEAAGDDVDAHLLLDADLAILGAAPAAYDVYAGAIRREYAWVPEEPYRHGRAELLRRFLQRPAIYRTAVMRAGHEQPARHNLRRELARL